MSFKKSAVGRSVESFIIEHATLEGNGVVNLACASAHEPYRSLCDFKKSEFKIAYVIVIVRDVISACIEYGDGNGIFDDSVIYCFGSEIQLVRMTANKSASVCGIRIFNLVTVLFDERRAVVDLGCTCGGYLDRTFGDFEFTLISGYIIICGNGVAVRIGDDNVVDCVGNDPYVCKRRSDDNLDFVSICKTATRFVETLIVVARRKRCAVVDFACACALDPNRPCCDGERAFVISYDVIVTFYFISACIDDGQSLDCV